MANHLDRVHECVPRISALRRRCRAAGAVAAYVDRSYALNIFLPKTRFGLSEIQWKLTGDRIEKLLSELDQAYVSVCRGCVFFMCMSRVPIHIYNMIYSKSSSESKEFRLFWQVTIPKMKIETTFELKEALSSLGISDIFGFNADLSGIADPPPPLISQATHKAIIEVDEDGTTAAAATLFKAQWKSLRVTVPIEFRADHPFLFILTKDKNPLFMGQFM
ncbi:serine proteinase inhibitor [Ostertagia ostertagi]